MNQHFMFFSLRKVYMYTTSSRDLRSEFGCFLTYLDPGVAFWEPVIVLNGLLNNKRHYIPCGEWTELPSQKFMRGRSRAKSKLWPAIFKLCFEICLCSFSLLIYHGHLKNTRTYRKSEVIHGWWFSSPATYFSHTVPAVTHKTWPPLPTTQPRQSRPIRPPAHHLGSPWVYIEPSKLYWVLRNPQCGAVSQVQLAHNSQG